MAVLIVAGNPELVGVRVRERREELNLSQTWVANRCGVSRSALCNIEAGRRGTTLQVLCSLACVLSVSSDVLLGLDS